MEQAYVSLTTNDDYAAGALVLGKSLRNAKTTRKLVLMVTSGVSQQKRNELCQYWDDLVDVTILHSNDKENLLLLDRPELACTFSKLRAWTLTQYKKCVFLDADTLVLQNIDDLFDREELSAAPDIGWPDCFNSGVFVFQPNQNTYDKLLLHTQTMGSFDGGDQGLLNEFFLDWSTVDISRHLPFIYNMVSNVSYTYAPAFKRFGHDVKVVHFLGAVKPWHHHFDMSSKKVVMLSTSSSSQSDAVFVQMWWDLYKASAQQENTGAVPSTSADTLPTSWHNWHESRNVQQKVISDRRSTWEQGNPDYTGVDSFENIQRHLASIMLQNQATGKEKPTTETTPTTKSGESSKPQTKKSDVTDKEDDDI